MSPQRLPSGWIRVLFCLQVGLWAAGASLSGQAVSFKRGDANGDDLLNITDPIYIIEKLFLDPQPIPCPDAADVDDDGRINITDGIAVAAYLFLGTAPAPSSPFEQCGPDPTSDALLCAEFSPCAVDEAPCLSDELLVDLLEGTEGFEVCLPAGLLEFPLDPLTVAVCPEDSAPLCGAAQSPGCPVALTSIEPFVDLEGQRVGLHVEGRVEDLPIAVTESVFNTTTVCTNDFGGAAAGSPFSFDLVVPLQTQEVKPGVIEIVGVGDGSLEDVDLVLDSSGGLVCALFEAGQGLFIDLLLAPLEQGLDSFAAQLSDAVVGLRICP
jgi:hypothetical protein